MLPVLERTAVLGKDPREQPPAQYILIAGGAEGGFQLMVDDVVPDSETGVNRARVRNQATGAWDVVAMMPKDYPWVLISADRVDMVSREQELRRKAEKASAERKLWEEIKPAGGEDEGEVQPRMIVLPMHQLTEGQAPKPAEDARPTPGQYI